MVEASVTTRKSLVDRIGKPLIIAKHSDDLAEFDILTVNYQLDLALTTKFRLSTRPGRFRYQERRLWNLDLSLVFPVA